MKRFISLILGIMIVFLITELHNDNYSVKETNPEPAVTITIKDI